MSFFDCGASPSVFCSEAYRGKTPSEYVMFKKVLQTIAAAMTLCLTMHLAIASEIVKVPTAWLGEHEAFLMWEMGLCREGSRPRHAR